MSIPRHIEFVEVGPRDGLQNEAVLISTENKIALINRAIEAGARRIEVTSFVNPKRVPQMADAEAVCADLPDRADITFIGLVMNQRGAERAIATNKIDQLGAVAVATNIFAMANQGQSSDESVEAARAIINLAHAEGRTAQCTIAASFGCPFEGEVPDRRVLDMALAIAGAGPVEIALADTIGVADPAHVARLVALVRKELGSLPVRVHFHNTRNTGIANVWAAVNAGATVVDASLGGLGGCPFAPGAAGNVPSEDVVYMLERAGVSTGMHLDRLIEASHWLSNIMGRKLPGMVAQSPSFPKVA